jgi:hypothetical protein
MEIRGSCPGKEQMNNETSGGGATVPCISLLADQFGTFGAFIGQCDSLAKDIAEKNPFHADADGNRMKLLVAIAREWNTANNMLSGSGEREKHHG